MYPAHYHVTLLPVPRDCLLRKKNCPKHPAARTACPGLPTPAFLPQNLHAYAFEPRPPRAHARHCRLRCHIHHHLVLDSVVSGFRFCRTTPDLPPHCIRCLVLHCHTTCAGFTRTRLPLLPACRSHPHYPHPAPLPPCTALATTCTAAAVPPHPFAFTTCACPPRSSPAHPRVRLAAAAHACLPACPAHLPAPPAPAPPRTPFTYPACGYLTGPALHCVWNTTFWLPLPPPTHRTPDTATLPATPAACGRTTRTLPPLDVAARAGLPLDVDGSAATHLQPPAALPHLHTTACTRHRIGTPPAFRIPPAMLPACTAHHLPHILDVTCRLVYLHYWWMALNGWV